MMRLMPYGTAPNIEQGFASDYEIEAAIATVITNKKDDFNNTDVPASAKQILYMDLSGLAGYYTNSQASKTINAYRNTELAPNALVFMPKGVAINDVNFAYMTEGEGFRASNNIVLTDKQPFFSPYDIQVPGTSYATYKRLITRPENGVEDQKATLILPFRLDVSSGVHTNKDEKCSFSLNTMDDNQNFSQGKSTVDHPSASFTPISGEWAEANTPYVVKVESCEEEGDDFNFVATQYGAPIVATPKQSGLGQKKFTGETVSGQYTNKKGVTTSYTCTSEGTFAGVIYDRAVSENVFYFAANMFLNLHTLAKAKGQYLYIYPFRAAYTYPDGGTGNSLLQFFDIDFEGPLGTDAIAEMPQQADLAVRTGNGYISMTSTIDQTVSVRSLNGMTVGELNMRAGDSKSINLPAGIYVVNNVKIIVK